MKTATSLSSHQRIVDVVRRANQIAVSTTLDELLSQTLDLFIEVADAETGVLYLYDFAQGELAIRSAKDNYERHWQIGMPVPDAQAMASIALQNNQPLFVSNAQNDPRWDFSSIARAGFDVQTAYCLPLVLRDQPIGVVQLFNLPASTLENEEIEVLLELVIGRTVSEIENARLLDEARQRERRLNALVDTISRLTTTLDRNELLQLIMNYARELLEVEATSVWELDEQQNVLIPYVATGDHAAELKEITVPVGRGIIGHVVKTGTLVQVDDVSKDQRHYQQVDRQSGFVTRSILCVPLRAPNIQLGQERGTLQESIIGGAQALNKRNNGVFTKDDIALFEAFASQAAAILQFSRLYQETHELFMGVIKVVAGAIDAKDPYTQGHSQRVSEFSVAIAEELGRPKEEIYHVRIGGILHDVGKIGVPDAILKKQDTLNEAEFNEIKKHPVKGYEIMSHAELKGLLGVELPGLLQHHERLDGGGYPNGLSGENISLIGRIIAVADVFDALTSDRPYRPGEPADEAMKYLRRGAGKEFDQDCVDALCQAWHNNKIKTQKERNK